MTINLSEIYAGLKAWRDERGITAQSQKESYSKCNGGAWRIGSGFAWFGV